MTKKQDIYKCNICGNIVEIVHEGAEALVCCNEPMILIEAITDKTKEGQEKHFPVIKQENDSKVTISIGDTPHPMTEEHYIEWIEVTTDKGEIKKQFLSPDKEPIAEFCVCGKIVSMRAYCNVHGLWAVDN